MSDATHLLEAAYAGDCRATIDRFAFDRLADRTPVKSEIVKLRFFAGLTVPDVAASINLPGATYVWCWAFAQIRLFSELNERAKNFSDS